MFPSPLNSEVIRLALEELGAGQRYNTETCVRRWQERVLSDEELLNAMMALTSQSSVLRHAFKKLSRQISDLKEVASADDLLVLMSLSDARPPLQRTSSYAPLMQKPAFVWAAAVEVTFEGTAKKRARAMFEGEPGLLSCS